MFSPLAYLSCINFYTFVDKPLGAVSSGPCEGKLTRETAPEIRQHFTPYYLLITQMPNKTRSSAAVPIELPTVISFTKSINIQKNINIKCFGWLVFKV